MEEEEQIRKRAANETALSAIGVRRKRPAPNSQESQVLNELAHPDQPVYLVSPAIICHRIILGSADWFTGEIC